MKQGGDFFVSSDQRAFSYVRAEITSSSTINSEQATRTTSIARALNPILRHFLRKFSHSTLNHA